MTRQWQDNDNVDIKRRQNVEDQAATSYLTATMTRQSQEKDNDNIKCGQSLSRLSLHDCNNDTSNKRILITREKKTLMFESPQWQDNDKRIENVEVSTSFLTE